MITLKGKNIIAEIPLDECSYFTKWAIAIDTSTSPELLWVLSERRKNPLSLSVKPQFSS